MMKTAGDKLAADLKNLKARKRGAKRAPPPRFVLPLGEHSPLLPCFVMLGRVVVTSDGGVAAVENGRPCQV